MNKRILFKRIAIVVAVLSALVLLTIALAPLIFKALLGSMCGDETWRKPTQAQIQKAFSDVEITLPPITNAISVELFRGLKGNTLTLTLPDEPSLTNLLITAFGNTNWSGGSAQVPSRGDKGYPWQFWFEPKILSNGINVVVMRGMQPYD